MKRDGKNPMKWFFIVPLSMLFLALAAALAGAWSGNFADEVIGWETDPLPEEAEPGGAVPVRLVMKLPFWVYPSEVSAVLPEHWIQSGGVEISSSPDRRLRRETEVALNFTPLAADLKPADAVISVSLNTWWGGEPEDFEAEVRLPGTGEIGNPGRAPLPLESVGVIEPAAPGRSGWLWGLIAAAGIVVVVTIFMLRSRKRTPAAAAPWEQALAELDELRRDLARGIRPEEAMLRLTDTVRVYLERRYCLPATRRTTPEFLNMLRAGALAVPGREQAALERFMLAAELVKFAGVRAERSMMANAVDDAENLVKAGMPSPGSEGGENV